MDLRNFRIFPISGKDSEMAAIFYSVQDDRPPHSALHREGLSLLRRGLAELSIREVTTDELINSISAGQYGKPQLPPDWGVHFSITHSGGLAACAIGSAPLGLDGELVRPYPAAVPSRVFSPGERLLLEDSHNRDELFFRLWTLKESLVKFTGRGITDELREMEFSFPRLSSFEEIACSVPGAVFSQYVLPEGYILSLCREEGDTVSKLCQMSPEFLKDPR